MVCNTQAEIAEEVDEENAYEAKAANSPHLPSRGGGPPGSPMQNSNERAYLTRKLASLQKQARAS